MESRTTPRWPWTCLALAMIWAAVVRVPLILNAETHLDSDLAVDGLTLLDATRGHLRWHFPGTPHMGIPPLWLALPQAMVFGGNAFTVVSGGIVACELVIVAIFSLAWRVFGPKVAAFSLVPLAFSSVGTVWLSGRLTGGHLLTVAWFAGTLAVLHAFLERGGWLRAFWLGLWCGFGFYVDQMVLSAFAGILPAAVGFAKTGAGWRRSLATVLAFAGGFALGDAPREIGFLRDPHDAYSEQFTTIFDPSVSGEKDSPKYWENVRTLVGMHSRILGLECVPRLIAGHILPKFQTHPLSMGRRPSLLISRPTTALDLYLFLAASVAMLDLRWKRSTSGALGVRIAIAMTCAAVFAGFILNRNIFNSDNYRYVVFLIVPWCVGFGLVVSGLWRFGAGGRRAAVILVGAFALLNTLDTGDWYHRFGWIDDLGRPVRKPLNDPALTWLNAHPEETAIFGGYWDVYRLSLLTGGRVKGIPFPGSVDQPASLDRFDEADEFPGRRPRWMVARPNDLGGFYPSLALKQGGTWLNRPRYPMIIDWPLSP